MQNSANLERPAFTEDAFGNTIQQRFLEYLNKLVLCSSPHRHVSGNDSDTDSAVSYDNVTDD